MSTVCADGCNGPVIHSNTRIFDIKVAGLLKKAIWQLAMCGSGEVGLNSFPLSE